MSAIYQAGLDTREVFRIEIADDGSYFAIRHETPKFAFNGATIEEVVSIAQAALQMIKSHRPPA